MTKATITDIAREMGITPSTVSRALADSPRVKLSTRQAIQKKAAEMGYERNIMASSLRKGVVSAVGIIVPRINRQFFGNIISSVEYELGKEGYTVLICQTHERLEDQIKAIKTLRANQVAGIMISHSIESVSSTDISEHLPEGIKLIQFDRVYSDLPGPKVINDGIQGSYNATMSLIRNGYRKIGTLAGYMDIRMFRDRRDGYFKALQEAGLPVDESLVYERCILRGTGREAAIEAIDAGCDALYCAGDFSALGALDAAKEKGLRVPEDFGIIGTANEQFTSLMSPSVSSLEQNPKEIGRAAAEAFLKLMAGEDAGEEIIVPMELIERESSTRS